MTVTAMARQSHRMAPRSDEHTREALRDHRDAARRSEPRSEPQRRDSTTTVWRAQLEGSQVVHDFDTEDEAMAWADAAANPDHWVVVWAAEVRG